MTTVDIPRWNAQGILPPIDSYNPTSHNRSPYNVSIIDLVILFGTTQKRMELLKGLIDFRETFYAAGICKGFQWINGSFVEDIKRIENREPADIDVVTFFHLPEGQTQKSFGSNHQNLFDRPRIKKMYNIDAFPALLDDIPSDNLVEISTYWYSLWSHRRSGQWKGFLQVDLSQRDDAVAKAEIPKITGGGSWE